MADGLAPMMEPHPVLTEAPPEAAPAVVEPAAVVPESDPLWDDGPDDGMG